jgi:hypothetical protein
MPPRTKKLLIVLAFPVFLLLYAGAVLAIADHVPNHWFVQLVFYITAGTVWAFPLKPVMLWANRPPQ